MRLAAVVNDSTTKLLFLNMAEAWLRLADHVELGKSYLVDEDMSTINSPEPGTTCDGDPDHDREA
jgi:hypothetical protein